MIVRDEERVIRDCLTSAKPFFREMLVLDTGSKDRTPEIAAACGAVVSHAEWPDSFALARTWSMKDAKGKWIMWMDADDTLPEHCGEIILNAVSNAGPEVVAMIVTVRFVEKNGFGTVVDHVKIFRNYPGLVWDGRIHEQILASVREKARESGLENGGLVLRTDAYVLHSGYDTSPEGQAKKRVRDAKLLKLDLKDFPNSSFRLFNMGMTEHFCGEHKDAVKWLKKCIHHSNRDESHLRKAYALLGASLRQIQKTADAEIVLKEGLEVCAGDPEIQFHLAQIAAERNEHEQAIQYYIGVLSADLQGVFTSIDPGVIGYKARHNMAMSYLAIGDYQNAKRTFEDSLRIDPLEETAIALFTCASEHGDLETCRKVLDFVRGSYGYGNAWAHVVGGLSALTGLDPSAHFDAVLRMQPENVEVRKAMGLHLLNSGQEQASVPHFDSLQQRGVPEGAFFLGVIAEQNGDLGRALGWYEHALRLNPAHAETQARIDRLRRTIG